MANSIKTCLMRFQSVIADHIPWPQKPLKVCRLQVGKRTAVLLDFLNFSMCECVENPCAPLNSTARHCRYFPQHPLCKIGRATIMFLRPTHETSSIRTGFYYSNSDINIMRFTRVHKDLLCIFIFKSLYILRNTKSCMSK